jgi:hypothetical protein
LSFSPFCSFSSPRKSSSMNWSRANIKQVHLRCAYAWPRHRPRYPAQSATRIPTSECRIAARSASDGIQRNMT